MEDKYDQPDAKHAQPQDQQALQKAYKQSHDLPPLPRSTTAENTCKSCNFSRAADLAVPVDDACRIVLPFRTTYGHSFIAHQFRHVKIGFRKNENPFVAVDDVAAYTGGRR
jgi:hypothetical protein